MALTDPRPDPPLHTAHFTVTGSTGGGTVWANTFWVRNGNAVQPSAADFDQLTQDFGSAWQSHFLAVLATQCTCTSCSSLYYGPSGQELAGFVGLGGTGSIAGGVMPANVSCCVGWHIQQHYKGGHPRTYLPGIPTVEASNPKLFATAYVTSVLNAANTFHTTVNSFTRGSFSGAKLGTVSFQLKRDWRNPPVFRDFTTGGAHVDQRIDSMRRRLGRDIPP